MTIAFIILAIVAAFWGYSVRNQSRTMSSGPREGTRFGGLVFTAIGGAVAGLLISLVLGTTVTVGSVFVGTLVGAGVAVVGFAVPFIPSILSAILGRAFGSR
jgi:hypothetical protein